MSLLAQTKYLCKKYGLKPHRPAGQNFLINENIISQIISTAEINIQDTVLEIGPGLGFITKELANQTKQVLAIELDRRLASAMKDLAKGFKNLKVIQNDVMKIKLDEFVNHKEYKLVSNLPFNITSWVLRNFLQYKPKPESITIVVQKEIAQRIVAKPGNMSILSVAVQVYSEPEIVKIINKENFWPQPKVDSAIIRINNIKGEIKGMIDEKSFFRVVKAGFSAKRKKLINSLSSGLQIDKANISQILSKVNINLDSRAQELSINDWREIYKNIQNILK